MHDYDEEYNEESFHDNKNNLNANSNNNNSSEEADRIRINYDELNEFKNYDVLELKLGNLSFLKRKRFSGNIDVKDEKIKLKMEKGEEEKPIPPINFIRWRTQKINQACTPKNININSKTGISTNTAKNIIRDEDDITTTININNIDNNDLNNKNININDFINDNINNNNKSKNDPNADLNNDLELDEYLNLVKSAQNYKMQSNCKIVEWSDGTIQLVIGSNYFDVNPSAMDNCRFAVFDKPNDMYVVKNPVKKRLLIMASEMTKNIEDRFKGSNESSTKTKLAYSFYDKNEYNKEDFAKKRYSKKAPNLIDKLRRNPDEGKKDLSSLLKRKNY